MERKKGLPTKGVLRQQKSNTNTTQNRYYPIESLKCFIEHYWSVDWDFPNDLSFTAETLPYPSIHLVFENGEANVYGVQQKRFSRSLSGKGSVFGIKFRPGGFYPFYKSPISQLANGVFPLESILTQNKNFNIDLKKDMFRLVEDERKIELIELWLKNLSPKDDPKLREVNQIIDVIISDKSITTVDTIAKIFSIKIRTLQRLFYEYVGVNPKWVIQQFRMQEIAERIEKSKSIHFADLANEFGFFDQAHFNRVFKKMIGCSPEKYLESLM